MRNLERHHIQLTPSERKDLDSLAAGNDNQLKLRAEIVLCWASGLTLKATAERLATSSATVSSWRRAYKNGGIRSFYTRGIVAISPRHTFAESMKAIASSGALPSPEQLATLTCLALSEVSEEKQSLDLYDRRMKSIEMLRKIAPKSKAGGASFEDLLGASDTEEPRSVTVEPDESTGSELDG